MNRSASQLARLGVTATVFAVLAGCAGIEEISTPTVDVPETVALGVMPEPLSDSPTLPPPPSPPTTVGEPAPEDTVPSEPLALPLRDHVDGHRLLMIGDGTLASAAPGTDRQLCDALSVFGWEAEVVTFAGVDDLTYVPAVLDLRLRPEEGVDWDAVALWVGNELPADGLGVADLTETLDATIERLAPRPVVLYTLTELDAGRVTFNEIIRTRSDEHPNVAVIDFGELAGAAEEVLELDGVSLSSDGRKRLPLITAQALGEAPVNDDGGCIDPDDD